VGLFYLSELSDHHQNLESVNPIIL